MFTGASWPPGSCLRWFLSSHAKKHERTMSLPLSLCFWPGPRSAPDMKEKDILPNYTEVFTEVFSNHQIDPKCTRRSFTALLSLAEGPPVAVAHSLKIQSANLEACCSACCLVCSARFGLVYRPGLALSVTLLSHGATNFCPCLSKAGHSSSSTQHFAQHMVWQ